MEFLGIGPLELFFILLIALIVLGPNDMVRAGKTIGRFLRRLVTSPNWRILQEASREIRHLPEKLMREAGLEEIKNELPDAQILRQEVEFKEINQDLGRLQDDLSEWTTPPGALSNSDKEKDQTPQENPASKAL